jgi:hypothetical protein
MTELICNGRIRCTQNDRKWYLKKGESSLVYSCCEICFNNHIKDTPKEEFYVETSYIHSANCDYYLYDSDYNFEDCSIILNNIRLSIIDDMGHRFKLDKELENTFLVDENIEYRFVIENLSAYKDKENSKIKLDYCKINNDEFKLYSPNEMENYIIEAKVSPLNTNKNSSTYNTIKDDDQNYVMVNTTNFENLNLSENDNLIFVVSKYNLFDNYQISELMQKDNGTFVDHTYGIEMLKLNTNEQNIKYKGFIGIEIYSNDTNNNASFNITIKRINKSPEIILENKNFDISI